MIETIHIYHTNDLHSHFEQWPKIVHYINKQREKHRQEHEEMFLFDIGDHMDRFHPISEASLGKMNIAFLNELKYDAVTIGNNEGITLPYEALDCLYEEATSDVIVANLYNSEGKIPIWAKPYQVYTTSSGIRLGVIGLTVYYQLFYELLGWEIRDPFEVIKEILKEISGQTDVIVLLSHLGINEDERLAELHDIDVILGGHTHHLLEEGKMINNSLVCGAGKYGMYIGHVELQIVTNTKAVITKRAEVIPTNDLVEESNSTKRTLQLAMEESEIMLGEQITVLKEDLVNNWFKESPLSQMLVETLKDWCEGEIAMINAGIILDSLSKGAISRKDIHRICPHPINPCNVWLKGDKLKEIILQAHTEQMENLRFKGLGFRGEVMGKMIYSGIEIESAKLSDGETHIRSIIINHEPLDHNRTYKISTIDMFTFGYLYPVIRDAKKKEFFMPELLRDLLINKFMDASL
ncbi:2',3'-cyclic-nucleotide 2'-phosphodiesterase/5'-or 3'-nucleotidase, 5'-nucleotidase family [Litchfieldia salsa]|uniref:2',3'-cyclic-nucleotide 2'-phosphodiesterase/5'-or 3'-nucleotidase, 5'-nucleotidase family n=1 Tax=Litchfieldia salsa TaxID=930152 RepID=A0A1H0WQ41_9BACI|nr:bifunctional UDP-sugar hydrolase/5'-nucleotidase [Litchfieldia salsa]SDP92757.1 2',3'-cyclic-nucleotide 2'-phosphodiesterase/5'-or 3'-nucleotidase, 5'-nucleotidase family [Litchfieldia salsa]